MIITDMQHKIAMKIIKSSKKMRILSGTENIHSIYCFNFMGPSNEFVIVTDDSLIYCTSGGSINTKYHYSIITGALAEDTGLKYYVKLLLGGAETARLRIFDKQECFLLVEHILDKIKKTTPTQAPAVSAVDEILKFKGLLDDGIITQAEFNQKKQQLLGL